MAENIIVASFSVESEAFQALSELKANPEVQGSYQTVQSVVVKKEDGQIAYKDSFDTGAESYDDTVKGGLIGALIGIVGGPVGILVGGGIGTFLGSGLDSNDVLENASMIEQVCSTLSDGSVSVISLVKEKEPGSFDSAFEKFGTNIVRFSKEEVIAELKKASELEKQMAKEARAKLREEKKEARRKKFEEAKDSVMAKLKDKDQTEEIKEEEQ